MIDILNDGHIHTRLCHHAVGEMEEYVLAAIRKGLHTICFLEHMEAGISYFETTWLSEEDFNFYFAEGKRLRNVYGDTIRIELGVEVGYNPSHRLELQDRLSKRSWDRIGISYHFYKPAGFSQHINLVSRKKHNIETLAQLGTDTVLHHYFDTLLEAVTYLPGTVLCHLDAALRFQPDLLLTEKHLEKVQALLDRVRQKKMALEINMSGIAIRKKPFPTTEIIQMARERGIPLVAGSDAHIPEDVGRFFDTLNQYVR